ncbi:MAG: cbb3-type cytochrome c oxidase subunit 3 [Novosphingobium sp.]|nr:cbb3-type cytochrome c oxidase subunit 3 [Novosphingobium sp.]
MSLHSTYEALRHFADSWALMAMTGLFGLLALWPFRPGASTRNEHAARMIFESDDHD